MAEGYAIYGPALRPGDIDWETPAATVAAGVSSADLVGLGLAENVDNWFGIRATSAAGVRDSATSRVAQVRITGGELVAGTPGVVAAARAEAVAGGVIRVDLHYSAVAPAGVSRTTRATVQVARVVGATLDWDHPLATVQVRQGTRRRVTLAATFADGERVELAARAVTAGGAVGEAVLLRPVTAAAGSPATPTTLTGAQA